MERNLQIPVWPYSDEREEAEIKKVFEHGQWWRNAGTEVKLFEQEFAQYLGCSGSVSVANGTVALEIALKALKIQTGDEVIVPDFTFYSTVSAVMAVGAKPVLVDVSKDDFCLTPALLEEAISEKTKAIIVVHMAGKVADMDSINEIAKKHDLYVIEDAAHAHGAEYKGKKAGSLGTCGTFSFQNAKLMTSGEGGLISSNDEKFLNTAFLESNCGRAEGDTTYQHVLVGTNARLSEFQGAILRCQLARLNQQLKLREENYLYLKEALEKLPGITLQKNDESVTLNSHYMVMFYYDKQYFNEKPRDEFVQYLKQNGVPCNRSFEAIHRLPIMSSIGDGNWRFGNEETGCKVSESIADTVVCLNHNILLGNRALLDDIVDIIKGFVDQTCKVDMDIKKKVLECIKSFAESKSLEFDANKGFVEQGINSLLFIELLVELEGIFGMEFDPFDLNVEEYKGIDDIVKYIESSLKNKEVQTVDREQNV